LTRRRIYLLFSSSSSSLCTLERNHIMLVSVSRISRNHDKWFIALWYPSKSRILYPISFTDDPSQAVSHPDDGGIYALSTFFNEKLFVCKNTSVDLKYRLFCKGIASETEKECARSSERILPKKF
jgi:hypothetical protein